MILSWNDQRNTRETHKDGNQTKVEYSSGAHARCRVYLGKKLKSKKEKKEIEKRKKTVGLFIRHCSSGLRNYNI
jgi:hypothetical protein